MLKKLGMNNDSIDKDSKSFELDNSPEKTLEQLRTETKQENIRNFKYNTTFSKFDKEASTMSALNRIPQQLTAIQKKNSIPLAANRKSHSVALPPLAGQSVELHKKMEPENPSDSYMNTQYTTFIPPDTEQSRLLAPPERPPRKSVLVRTRLDREAQKRKSF